MQRNAKDCPTQQLLDHSQTVRQHNPYQKIIFDLRKNLQKNKTKISKKGSVTLHNLFC